MNIKLLPNRKLRTKNVSDKCWKQCRKVEWKALIDLCCYNAKFEFWLWSNASTKWLTKVVWMESRKPTLECICSILVWIWLRKIRENQRATAAENGGIPGILDMPAFKHLWNVGEFCYSLSTWCYAGRSKEYLNPMVTWDFAANIRRKMLTLLLTTQNNGILPPAL